MNGGVNLDAIAGRLNISKATVSRALRNQPGIHPTTRSLVMTTAAEMGYYPQRTRSVVASSDHLHIGVLVRSWREEWQGLSFLTGMTETAPELNVSLVLEHARLNDAERIMDPQRQPPAIRQGTLSGAVLVHRWPDAVVRYLAKRFLCVSVVHRYDGIPMDTVDIDHDGGMAMLVRHLAALGHRRIGFVGRSSDLSWSRARFGAYVEALYTLGLPFDPELIVETPTELLEDNRIPFEEPVERVATLVRSGVRAWMGASDWVGYSVCRGLMDRGFRVPQDVSVTGFDAREISSLGCPPLTSVRVPTEHMGAEALRRVVARLKSPGPYYQSILFDCALREGETTGPAPRL